MMLDDLELELRKLPGVRAAGFDERDDVLMIQLHVASDPGHELDVPLPIAATRIATRHSDRPVAVEVVRWRDVVAPNAGARVTPIGPAPADAGPIGQAAEPSAAPAPPIAVPIEVAERPRLLAVLSFPDTDELEVHLVLGGRRTIGRAPASRGLLGAVDATIEAIRSLGVGLEPTAKWSRALDAGDDGSVLVAAALDVTDDAEAAHLYGLASGTSPIDAAARATLDALNRRLTRRLA
jgi:hypothetical protein